jgi:hypothetical protein
LGSRALSGSGVTHPTEKLKRKPGKKESRKKSKNLFISCQSSSLQKHFLKAVKEQERRG